MPPSAAQGGRSPVGRSHRRVLDIRWESSFHPTAVAAGCVFRRLRRTVRREQDAPMERSATEFAWNGGSALAYQVLGEGDPTVFYLPGFVSNVELNWEHPSMSGFLRRLARDRRLIVMDPRGLGCSERGTPAD